MEVLARAFWRLSAAFTNPTEPLDPRLRIREECKKSSSPLGEAQLPFHAAIIEAPRFFPDRKRVRYTKFRKEKKIVTKAKKLKQKVKSLSKHFRKLDLANIEPVKLPVPVFPDFPDFPGPPIWALYPSPQDPESSLYNYFEYSFPEDDLDDVSSLDSSYAWVTETSRNGLDTKTSQNSSTNGEFSPETDESSTFELTSNNKEASLATGNEYCLALLPANSPCYFDFKKTYETQKLEVLIDLKQFEEPVFSLNSISPISLELFKLVIEDCSSLQQIFPQPVPHSVLTLELAPSQVFATKLPTIGPKRFVSPPLLSLSTDHVDLSLFVDFRIPASLWSPTSKHTLSLPASTEDLSRNKPSNNFNRKINDELTLSTNFKVALSQSIVPVDVEPCLGVTKHRSITKSYECQRQCFVSRVTTDESGQRVLICYPVNYREESEIPTKIQKLSQAIGYVLPSESDGALVGFYYETLEELDNDLSNFLWIEDDEEVVVPNDDLFAAHNYFPIASLLAKVNIEYIKQKTNCDSANVPLLSFDLVNGLYDAELQKLSGRFDDARHIFDGATGDTITKQAEDFMVVSFGIFRDLKNTVNAIRKDGLQSPVVRYIAVGRDLDRIYTLGSALAERLDYLEDSFAKYSSSQLMEQLSETVLAEALEHRKLANMIMEAKFELSTVKMSTELDLEVYSTYLARPASEVSNIIRSYNNIFKKILRPVFSDMDFRELHVRSGKSLYDESCGSFDVDYYSDAEFKLTWTYGQLEQGLHFLQRLEGYIHERLLCLDTKLAIGIA